MQSNLSTQQCENSKNQPRQSAAADTRLTPPKQSDTSAGAQIATLLAEAVEMRAQLERLRSERNTLAEQQRRIQELIGASSPDRLVHDLRNVLNERELLKALVNEM